MAPSSTHVSQWLQNHNKSTSKERDPVLPSDPPSSSSSSSSSSLPASSSSPPSYGGITRQQADTSGTGTLGSSILILIASVLGSSILAVPYAFSQCGWILGTLCLIACGLHAIRHPFPPRKRTIHRFLFPFFLFLPAATHLRRHCCPRHPPPRLPSQSSGRRQLP